MKRGLFGVKEVPQLSEGLHEAGLLKHAAAAQSEDDEVVEHAVVLVIDNEPLAVG